MSIIRLQQSIASRMNQQRVDQSEARITPLTNAVPAQSYQQRQSIDQNRQVINNFRSSGVHYYHRDNAHASRTDLTRQSTNGQSTTAGISASPQARKPASSQKSTFREPPRRYNPYS